MSHLPPKQRSPVLTARSPEPHYPREHESPASADDDAHSAWRAHSRGAEHRRADADSGTDANLSPWTGVGSPSSSDFEAINDSEVVHLGNPNSSAQPLPPAPAQYAQPASVPSNLARSLSQQRMRQDSSGSSVGRGRGFDRRADFDDELHRRGIEGDDEDSSAFEDADESRGRARTRRGRDPELKRSMLEDALRSSLATLLSLAPAQAGLSQTPSMSHASLASLFQPTASSSSSASAGASGSSASTASLNSRQQTGTRPSPFATALIDPLEEDDELSSSSVAEDVFAPSSSSSDEEGTQLAPASPSAHRTRAIPIASPSRSRTRPYFGTSSSYRAYSDSASHAAAAASSGQFAAAGFSPLQPSRPLGSAAAGLPSSNSPPHYSRSRRGAAALPASALRSRRGGGGGGGRGRGGSTSPGPGPASVEERRRARAEAALRAAGTGMGRSWAPGEGAPERRDNAFQELVDAARFFSDLSPRASLRPLPQTSPTRTREPTRPSSSWPLPSFARPPTVAGSSSSTPPFYSDEDPALASESVPTLEGLSSGAEGEQSPLPASDDKGDKSAKAGLGGAGDGKGEEPRRQGWFSWLKGLGATVEIKVWHLVGICGVLIGVGIGASALVRSLVPASWLASRLDFVHHAHPLLSTATPPSNDYEGRFDAPSSHEGMSTLFL
ncbi:hypothetical protein Rhopal_002567-T1 [Rhodotorula paludigena]|uniref:Proteophosphoglycan ppg4 n=1 Tax=Rhodotorula paludigena TaxID=86838 RepID=A0AAV5GJB5_9BASI|nr:hypothetical protein Rhopal_002567-T1 [Rhodotorula paludigena]